MLSNSAKTVSTKKLGKNIGYLIKSSNKLNGNVTCLYVIYDEVVSQFNMLGSRVLDGIFAQANSISVITRHGNLLNVNQKSCYVCFIQRIWAQQHPALYIRLPPWTRRLNCNFTKPRHKTRSKKMTSFTCALSIGTTTKKTGVKVSFYVKIYSFRISKSQINNVLKIEKYIWRLLNQTLLS